MLHLALVLLDEVGLVFEVGFEQLKLLIELLLVQVILVQVQVHGDIHGLVILLSDVLGGWVVGAAVRERPGRQEIMVDQLFDLQLSDLVLN